MGAYGTLDELNAALGFACAQVGVSSEILKPVTRVQSELFHLGAELATPTGKANKAKLVGASEIEALEHEIDSMETKLRPLKTFILPGGSATGAALHIARTVCRRAEREIITLVESEPSREEVVQYVNRLSDWLFVMARYANHLAGAHETPWLP